MSDQEEAGPSWISLAAACRVTLRPDITIKGWKTSGAFAKDEWRYDESRRQGVGHPILIRVDALERVHRDRGGVYWRPELADAVNPSPGVKRQIEALEDELKNRERRIRDLERRLDEATARRGRYTPDVAADPDGDTVPLKRYAPAPLPARRYHTPASPASFADVQGSLPPGLVSCNAFAVAHGFGRNRQSSWHDAYDRGTFRDGVMVGKWLQGSAHVRFALNLLGRQTFVARFGHLHYFKPCGQPDCPCAKDHISQESIADGVLAATGS
jgi:hypothetical protein